jgi:enamine deaminase RidA (YjgF/YER057c/UK114 family)
VTADERVQELGLEIPEFPALPFRPKLVPIRVHDGLAYLSGIGPIGRSGVVGADLTVEEAREAARITTLYLLSTLRSEIGSLDRVHSIVKVFGSVNAAPGFTDTPAVIDGSSDLLVEVFGPDVGRHARAAIGVAELPENAAVEIEMVVAVKEAP